MRVESTAIAPPEGPAAAIRSRRVLRALLAGWTLFILYGSFIPFRLDTGPVAPKLAMLPLVPFQGGVKNFSVPDVVSNLALFVPFGFLLVAGARRLRERGPLACAGAAGVPALALTVAVETGQLFAADRVVSALDVQAETVGAVVGAVAAWRLADRAEDLIAAAVDVVRGDPGMLALAALGYYLVVHAFFPFDVTLDVGALRQSVRAGNWAPWMPRRFWADVFVERTVAFSLVAGLVRSRLARLPAPRAERTGAFGGAAGMVAALEVGKVFFVGRSPDMTNLAFGLVGAALGALVATPGRTHGIGPTALAVALLAWAQLTPFALALSGEVIEAGVRRIEWLPFVAYFYADPRRVVLDLGDKLLLSGFLGLAIARLSSRPVLGAVLAGALGLALEAMQLLTPSRTPSTTDVLVFVGGAIVGAAAAPRLAAARTVDPARTGG